MKKHFVCLANSFKYQGRCLAGIEIRMNNETYSVVTKGDGTPQWIRPVSRNGHGELPTLEARNIDLLDVVEIENIETCPKNAHSENVFYSSLGKIGKKIENHAHRLNDLCDKINPLLFFNRGKAVPVYVFEQEGHSLVFVKVSEHAFYNDEKEKLRVKFLYGSTPYDLPVTDPKFINRMKSKGLGHINAESDYYFTVSLAEELNGWHAKLVAGVISPLN